MAYSGRFALSQERCPDHPLGVPAPIAPGHENKFSAAVRAALPRGRVVVTRELSVLVVSAVTAIRVAGQLGGLGEVGAAQRNLLG